MLTIIEPSFEILTPFEGFAEHIELCGRTCYKSESYITEGSEDKFITRIIRSGHESVLEHASVSIRVTCSRACSHQIVRSRLCSFSQQSQRFCAYGKQDSLKVICPKSIDITPGDYVTKYTEEYGGLIWKDGDFWGLANSRQIQWLLQVDGAYSEYKAELTEGIKPEDARYILPNSTQTELVVTANLRQWRLMFKQRALNQRAQWEIRGIYKGILNEFIERCPAVFKDLGEDND